MDWALLPPELLHLIAEKLAFNDYRCFSCVCTSWHAIEKSNRNLVQPIWLMLPSISSSDYLDFYNFSNDKIDKFYVPGVVDKFCFGLNIGFWILALDESNNFSFDHLFTRTTIHILRLPDTICAPKTTPIRALISSDPSTTIDWTLILSLQYDRNFKYVLFNNKHEEWTFIDELWPGKIFKSIVHENQLCAANCSHDILVSHLDPPSYRIIDNSWMHDANYGCHGLYLVESMGDLLLVARDRSEMEEFEYFSVFRMDDMRGEEPKWVRVRSIADRAIFVSDNHCVSMDVGEFGGLFRGNCVYFCDPLGKFEGSGKNCLGVYNLEDYSVELVSCCFDSTQDWKRASWFG